MPLYGSKHDANVDGRYHEIPTFVATEGFCPSGVGVSFQQFSDELFMGARDVRARVGLYRQTVG